MPLHDFLPQTPLSMTNDPKAEPIGNTVDSLVDIFPDDFNALQGMLAERNMKLGKFLGAGSVGVAYELETNDGKKIDSAVIRLDPPEARGNLDSAAAIEQIGSVESEFFAATIVPRAYEWVEKKKEMTESGKEVSVPMVPDKAALKQSLAVLNAEDTFGHLTDMKADQFMTVPGIDIPVLADPTSMRVSTNWGGGITEMCESEAVQFDPKEIFETKAPQAFVDHIRSQKNAVGDKVRAELTEKGVNFTSVPKVMEIDHADPAIEEQKKHQQGLQ